MGVFEVYGCGSAQFNGYYTQSSKAGYEKIGGTETIDFFRGYWLMLKNHGGHFWYQASSNASSPPESGWNVGMKGKPGKPRLRYLNNKHKLVRKAHTSD
jgi:hypothetical protein